jgi:ribosomal-protein-alanine N-acetyltransferase
MELRVATPDDIDGIMALETPTFGTDAWSAETMGSELRSTHTYYLVAVEGDTTLGYGGLLAPQGSEDADIQTIAVAPFARRTGLGRQLMTALIGEAASRNAKHVFLEVRADNPNARALYDSLGFEEIALRPKYYQPDGVDAQIMRLAL